MTSATARIQRPTSQEVARARIKLRKHPTEGNQVYTFLAGSSPTIWKWFNINEETFSWYRDMFHVEVIPYSEQENPS